MSSGLIDLLGDKILSGAEVVPTNDVLAGKGAVALYFSAHWCPPCRGFTPQFAEWYNESLKAKGLEVIFISSDKTEDAFKEYFGEQPWKALPYVDRERKETLSKKFKVQGIPSIVVLDSDGQVITKDGRDAISGDPKGEDFPWKPKSLTEILAGSKFIGKDGPADAKALDGKVFGLYFSAHWCPPCRGFTPQLAEWYSKSLKDKDFEVVFVSSDRDEDAFKEYFAEQPWLALDFANRKEKEQLSNMFGIKGIPSLVIIDKDGSTITKEGKASVSGDPEGKEFPWYPKPVSNLASGPGHLNDAAVVVAFCEAADAAAQKEAEAAMTPLATKYIDEAKAAGEEVPKVCFMIATASGGISGQLRSMLKLPSLAPSLHEHPLELRDSTGGWGCDGCNKSGTADMSRHRCTQGCDFDFCGECHSKAGQESKQLPQIMLINIPDDGAFYDGGYDITTEAVEKFVAAFAAGSLEKQQLKK